MFKLLTATAVASLILVTVPAPSLADPNDKPIEQITVTAARAPLAVNRVGQATTVITRADIENRQARYVTDMLRSVPGFAVSHTGVAGSQTQVRVRGSESNHVLVLIDGVRATDPATGDDYRWEHLATGNIERIEIVRGPQSALWGSDAIGATVNIITRTDAGRQGLSTYAEAGSHDTLNLGVDVTQSVDAWTLSANLESLETDGADISRTGTEDDGSDLTSASIGARFAGSGHTTFAATLSALEAASEFDPVGATGIPVDGDRKTRSENLIGKLVVTAATFDDRVLWRMSGSYFESEHRNFVDGSADSMTASERLSFSLQAAIELGQNRLVLAAEREESDFKRRGEVVFGDPNQDQSMQVSSAVVEYQHLAMERLTLLLSGRFDNSSDFDDAATGRVSLAWQAGAYTRLRASVGSGQKSPTFTERFGLFPGQFVGNPDLKPEKSLAYEMGISRSLFDDSAALDATVFWQTLDEEINGFVFDPVTFVGTAENRSGESERRGAEISADWQITPRVKARLSYTYTHATEEDALGATSVELRRPRHLGGVLFDIGSPSARFALTLGADYGGTRSDVFFPPFPEPSQIVHLDRYWLVDFTARYQVTDAITLYARASNLLDEEYEQVFGYQTLGRTVFVGVKTALGN